MLKISRGILLQVIKNPDVKYFNKPSAPWEKPKGLQTHFCSTAYAGGGQKDREIFEKISQILPVFWKITTKPQ